jgi:hypothetical protein
MVNHNMVRGGGERGGLVGLKRATWISNMGSSSVGARQLCICPAFSAILSRCTQQHAPFPYMRWNPWSHLVNTYSDFCNQQLDPSTSLALIAISHQVSQP